MSSRRAVEHGVGGQGVDDADAVAALALPPRRHDQGHALPGPGPAPGSVAGLVPAVDGEQHDRQLGVEQQPEPVTAIDLGGEPAGHVERRLHGLGVGVGPVRGQAEPQRQPAGPP